ncbi:MAG: TetR/AcrR family transcriptional regulator [Deferrisomatales bacterium]
MKKWGEWGRKGWERAERIGRAAAELFSRRGYLVTTMEDIAEAAGTSKGGVYHYFDSKAAVLYFVLDNYMDLTLRGLEEGLSEIAGEHDKIRFVISRHISIHVDNTAEGKVLLHDAHCLPAEYLDVIHDKERRYYGIVSGVVRGILGGRVEPERTPVITFCLFGMCNWIYSWYDPAGSVPPEELADTIYGILLGGVGGLEKSPGRGVGVPVAAHSGPGQPDGR